MHHISACDVCILRCCQGCVVTSSQTSCSRMLTQLALYSRARVSRARSLHTAMKQTAAVVLDDSCKGKQAQLTILKDFPVKEPQEVCCCALLSLCAWTCAHESHPLWPGSLSLSFLACTFDWRRLAGRSPREHLFKTHQPGRHKNVVAHISR